MKKLTFILSLLFSLQSFSQYAVLGYVRDHVVTGTTQVMFIGTSLTEGYNTDDRPNKNWGKKAFNKLDLRYPSNFTNYQNFGTGGATMANIAGGQLTSAIAAIDGSDKHILVIEGGVNDIGTGATAASVYATMRTAHIDAVAAGFRTIAVTVAAYNYSAYNPSTTNAVRLALNTLIRNGIDSGDLPASGLIDLGNDQHFGTWNSGGQDPIYIDSADDIHWTEEGHRYVGEDLAYHIILEVQED